MDRTDVERLVRVEGGFTSLGEKLDDFVDRTDPRLERIERKLDSLGGTASTLTGVGTLLGKLPPYVAMLIAIAALLQKG